MTASVTTVDPAAPASPPPPAPTGGKPRRRRTVPSPLVEPMPRDLLWGWVGPILVTLFAGGLRFWRLGVPPTMIFDEVYYAEQGQDLLRYGVEYNQDNAGPDFIVHPPAGKWVIAAGQWALGNNAVGWRFAVALLGTLSVLLVARIGRRLFRSTLLGCTAALLLAVDGMHFVHSRTALLDLVLMFFVLAAFGCLLVDRDSARAALSARLGSAGGPTAYGPGLGLRTWRLAAGVLLGLACATKWNGIWFVAAFGLLTVLWDVGARRRAGVARPWAGTLVRDAAPAFAALVLLAMAVYVASWAGWFLAGPDTAYGRDWATTRPATGLAGVVPDALRSLWHYHAQMLTFHRDLDTWHPYRSNPWGWLLLTRPVSFFYETPAPGEAGCAADQCSQAIAAIGTPLLWWGAAAAAVVLGYLWAGARDWRAGAILCGLAAGYLPWFLFQGRTIYSFYAVVVSPWLALAVAMVLGMVLGSADASPLHRRRRAFLAASFVLLVVVNFAYFFPVLAAQVVTYEEWSERMWLPSWI